MRASATGSAASGNGGFWNISSATTRISPRTWTCVHFDPVKHGRVADVADRPYSTLEACVQRDLYPEGRLGLLEHTLSAEEAGENAFGGSRFALDPPYL